MDLLTKTKILCAQNECNFALYLKNRDIQIQYDFYRDIKPFVDDAKEKGDIFLEEAIPWVKHAAPLYLSERQLKQAAENIQLTAINAFNGKSFYKSFHDHYESSKYTLNRVISCMKGVQEEEK